MYKTAIKCGEAKCLISMVGSEEASTSKSLLGKGGKKNVLINKLKLLKTQFFSVKLSSSRSVKITFCTGVMMTETLGRPLPSIWLSW